MCDLFVRSGPAKTSARFDLCGRWGEEGEKGGSGWKGGMGLRSSNGVLGSAIRAFRIAAPAARDYGRAVFFVFVGGVAKRKKILS